MRKILALFVSMLVIAACTPPDFDDGLNNDSEENVNGTEGTESSDDTNVPKNMIYYTTANGEILTPNEVDSYTFGATLISNTYEDGKGILTFDNDVTSIGNSAFYGCSGLTSITIPNSVTSIGAKAFSSCSGLTSITIPNSVTSIGSSAFYGCRGLTSITIPNSVTSIGEEAFSYCSGLTSITVTDGNTVYDSRDNCNAIIETATNTLIAGCKNTIIPNSVTSIGDYAFWFCSGLTSVTIGNSVTNIGKEAFAYCSGLTCITIPNSVTSIGEWVFYGCSGLTSITIPNSVTSIGYSAFYYCIGLEEVHITDLDAWKNISFGDYDANPLNNSNAKLYLNGVEVTDY